MKMYQHLIIQILAFTLIGCTNPKNKDSNAEHTAITGLNYAVVTTSQDINNITLNGKVSYNEDELLTFNPIGDGVVLDTYFSLGDFVKKGQRLLKIKSDSYYELQSEYKATQNDVYLATRNLNKANQMFEDKLYSEQDLIEAKIELNKVKEEEQRLKTALKMYGQDIGNGIYQVNAQTSGYVFKKHASPSLSITPESELYTLGKLNNLWVIANIYTQDLPSIETGTDVIITSSAYPDKQFAGKINRILPFVDTEDKVVKARVDFQNTDLLLKPDFTVDVHVQNKSNVGKLRIPTKSIIFDKNNFYVVAMRNNNLEAVKLDIYKQTDTYTFINKGLQEGELILIENQLLYYTQINQR